MSDHKYTLLHVHCLPYFARVFAEDLEARRRHPHSPVACTSFTCAKFYLRTLASCLSQPARRMLGTMIAEHLAIYPRVPRRKVMVPPMSEPDYHKAHRVWWASFPA